MRAFSVPTPEKIASILGRRPTDTWRLFDTSSELADYVEARHTGSQYFTRDSLSYFGNDDGPTVARKSRTGDLSAAASSEDMMARFERFAFETERKAWRDDICGGFPNVPAFLAGNPLSMRRRIADASAAAPIAVIVDLSSSGGIGSERIHRRGVAILAFVRLLAMRRPVELWAGAMNGGRNKENRAGGMGLSAIFTRIETAPLDLATAAYVITNPGFCRRLCYAISNMESDWDGQWPYSSIYIATSRMAEMCAPAFTHCAETLCIPAVTSNDRLAREPEQWIEQKLAELAPVNLYAA